MKNLSPTPVAVRSVRHGQGSESQGWPVRLLTEPAIQFFQHLRGLRVERHIQLSHLSKRLMAFDAPHFFVFGIAALATDIGQIAIRFGKFFLPLSVTRVLLLEC